MGDAEAGELGEVVHQSQVQGQREGGRIMELQGLQADQEGQAVDVAGHQLAAREGEVTQR